MRNPTFVPFRNEGCHRAAKRNLINLEGGNDIDPVRLLCASGEQDIPLGGL